jgi:serine/threonine-protein kinase
MGERATAASIVPGAILNNTYRIERLLGEGGMGAVWEASHLRVPKRVAVKVLLAATSPDQIARFRQEAEIASRLGHPNIVDVLDFDTAFGTPYMVMELLQGESLATRLERGPLDAERTVTIVRQIAGALQAAHDAGVIHRDLKPANVFLVPRELDGEPTDEVKVLDFGISKVQGSQVVRTGEDTVLGTPQYMAPEQATARHDELDARTDQFALAAIAYEMLAGRPAFEGDNATQVMFKIVYESAPPIESRVDGVPAPMARAIARGMSTRPGARYPDLSSFVEELSGRPLKPPTDRMNQGTLAASPVRRDVEAKTQRESQTVAERPSQRRPPRRRVASAVAVAAAIAGGAITAFVIAKLTSGHSGAGGDAAVMRTEPADEAPPVIAKAPPPAPADAAEVVIDAAPAMPTGSGSPPHTPPPAALPPDVAAVLDRAETELAKGDLDAAEHDVRTTLYTHEYTRADILLATISCARHDVASARGFMRRAGAASWPTIQKRCTKLGFQLSDPD